MRSAASQGVAPWEAGKADSSRAERYDVLYCPLGAAACGGAERSILELAAAQQATGRRVLVLYEAALDSTDFVALARNFGVNVARVPWSPESTGWQVWRSARQVFSGMDTEIIHFNISWRPWMWLVALAARVSTRARLVGTMRAMPERFGDLPHKRYFGGLIPGPRIWAWSDYFTGRVWARALHATVSVNRDDYPPRLIQAFGFRRGALSVIYNGVGIPERQPTAEDRIQARQRLGIEPDGLVVGYVGRVSPEKGVRHLFEAIRRCKQPVCLVVAGEGSELGALQALADSDGLRDKVRFLGYVSPPDDVLTAVDILVVPSLWNEAFGRVVVEGMGRGAAVIATAVGGMQEIFENDKEGLLIPKGDADAIAQAIDRLATDVPLRRELSRRGFELARERYATSRVSAQYGDLYRAIAG